MSSLPEHVDVLIVGAGLAGIATSWHLARQCPDHTQAIVEARDRVGGTWDLFRYPGIRSDSDRFTLGFRFAPWNTDAPYASGEELRDYIESTAVRHGIHRRIHFRHRLLQASWDSADARWTVTLQVGPDQTVTRTCRFLYTCTGYFAYDQGHTPSWAGRDTFSGPVVHPQHWPEDLEVEGKRLVVIGSGATAVSLVPALVEQGAEVTMLQRTPTYVVPTPSSSVVARLAHRWLPASWAHRLARTHHALDQALTYTAARAFPTTARRWIDRLRHRFLPASFDDAFHPPYAPWDQRVCADPDGAMLRTLADGRATVVTDTIDRFDEQGLRLSSGQHLEADVVVTATGLHMTLLHGVELLVDGVRRRPEDCLTWRGMMYSDVPNLFTAFGYANASWTLRCELVAERVGRILKRMARRGETVCVASPEPDLPTAPWSPLSSGYIARARLPRQARAPWVAGRSYLTDLLTLRTPAALDGLAFRRTGRAERLRGPRMDLDGRVAVVTGAARGIGLGIARALAARGCRLILVDIDVVALRDAAAALPHVDLVVPLDVADGDAITAFAQDLAHHHAEVDLLVNNAGVALGGSFRDTDPVDVSWLFGINILGPMALTRALLPLLERSHDARIVNVSSLFGLVAPPGHVAYAASKFAMRGFSEGLRQELSDTAIGLTLVHPGGVDTSIAASARVPADTPAHLVAEEKSRVERWLTMAPDDAGERIVAAVVERRDRLLLGRETHLLSWLARLAPVAHGRALRWALERS